MRYCIIISLAILQVSIALSCVRRGAECPDYNVINVFHGYEEREYPPTTWIMTSVQATNYRELGSELYTKLRSYLKGNNDQGLSFNMTTPVRTRIDQGTCATCASTYSMSFFLPRALQKDPPKPLDPSVNVLVEPKTRYFVSIFDGFASYEDWIRHANKLALKLDERNDMEKNYYYTAEYDSPRRRSRRRNEVWMEEKKIKHN
ncbi:heme-binding protein 2-like [Limulus polyphemus]|uniref:Heme-binding protein 2-like n=1 Tax=Limulus polyphemus TaxID=6850 RepID=A0ABM1BNH3_LIMPO|nr:heme-binding protein 2-like [Limulus polyphemus]